MMETTYFSPLRDPDFTFLTSAKSFSPGGDYGNLRGHLDDIPEYIPEFVPKFDMNTDFHYITNSGINFGMNSGTNFLVSSKLCLSKLGALHTI